jgi:hypothetical protein
MEGLHQACKHPYNKGRDRQKHQHDYGSGREEHAEQRVEHEGSHDDQEPAWETDKEIEKKSARRQIYASYYSLSRKCLLTF